MYPFMRCFDEAVNPPREARIDLEVFRVLTCLVGCMVPGHLGTQIDVVTVPLGHDSPDATTMVDGVAPRQT